MTRSTKNARVDHSQHRCAVPLGLFHRWDLKKSSQNNVEDAIKLEIINNKNSSVDEIKVESYAKYTRYNIKRVTFSNYIFLFYETVK